MRNFMDKDFLLESDTARALYHGHGAKMPIVDYHCHISPREIYENHRFDDIAQAWLGGDHYKWRLMRACGVDEEYISGGKSGWEKFYAFAGVLPKAIGNPVYHWAHLELQRYFNCHTPLNEKTAKEIWEHCNAMLKEDRLSVRGIIESSRVTALCTTDDPVDSLEWHKKLAEDKSFKTKVLPAFRPDKALNVEKQGFAEYIKALEEAAGFEIKTIEQLEKALESRVAYFNSFGCRASDHGVDGVDYLEGSGEEAQQAMDDALAGRPVGQRQASVFRTRLLAFLGRQYAKYGWVMEIHFGAMRNNNSPAFEKMGPDTGYDCISPNPGMTGLSRLLNNLESTGELPKTLIFSLNPTDDAAINTLCGCFAQKGIPGKVQQGSAWWFNDSYNGMTQQMTSFASLSVLGNFAGMLTDSRSFLSYARHEYFRRILCNLVGGWVDKGMYPADMEFLGQMIEDISYNNAVKMFGF